MGNSASLVTSHWNLFKLLLSLSICVENEAYDRKIDSGFHKHTRQDNIFPMYDTVQIHLWEHVISCKRMLLFISAVR